MIAAAAAETSRNHRPARVMAAPTVAPRSLSRQVHDTQTSSHVDFRFPPFLSSTCPCSAQDITRSLNSTVLHCLALEGVAASRETQRGATEIRCF